MKRTSIKNEIALSSVPELRDFVFSKTGKIHYNLMWFETVCHAYSASAFLDPRLRIEIQKCRDPLDAYRYLVEFQKYIDPRWSRYRYPILCRIVHEKFLFNSTLKEALLSTKDAELINDLDDGVYPEVPFNGISSSLMYARSCIQFGADLHTHTLLSPTKEKSDVQEEKSFESVIRKAKAIVKKGKKGVQRNGRKAGS